jgi:uncharacterized membrane protein YfcA
MSLADWLWATAVLLLAGFIKGVIGLGLPAVGVGLLGLMMPPVRAAAILVVPGSVTNVWQIFTGRGFWRVLRRTWPMQLGIPLGCWLAGGALAGGNTARIRVFLGLVLGAYAVFGLLARRLRVKPRWERWLAPLIGIGTGLVTSATGLSTLPSVPYLAGLDGFDRDELVQALGITFTVCSFSLGVDLIGRGQFDRELLIASALAVVPAVAGMQLGAWARGRISPVLFRRCFYTGMLLLGIELARH